MTNNAAKKFTARNLPALEKLAAECGLTYVHRNWSKCYTFAPNAHVNGDFEPLCEEDQNKLVAFCESANSMFGDREHFFAANHWRFARVSWERDCRTESQKNNCD